MAAMSAFRPSVLAVAAIAVAAVAVVAQAADLMMPP
jgi:hypothetical protein